MRTITIEFDVGSEYTVREGDLSAGELCWDEMLGTIAELTHPRIGEARYAMRTEAELVEYRARYGPKPDQAPDAPALLLTHKDPQCSSFQKPK